MKQFTLYIALLCSCFSFSQETLTELLDSLNNKSIPYISVQELAMPKTNAVILDARESKEYNTSHLKNAIHVGYDAFNLDTVIQNIENKDQKIVVYCTLGVRSEDIAEKLKSAGYINVYNLFGGIVEWKNNRFKVFNSENTETEDVHVCNEYWSKWLTNGVKVYD